MTSSRRVVVTGMGVITSLGQDLPTFWGNVLAGRSAVRRLERFDTSALPVHIAAPLDGFDARKYLDKKERKRLAIMPPTFQYAAAASQLALDDARLDKASLDPARLGAVFGSATIPSDLRDIGPAAQLSVPAGAQRVDERLWGEKGIPAIAPLWMLGHIPNMMACHVTILHNVQGPNNTITQSDAGGLLALIEASRHIQSDRADVFFVGGADNKLSPVNFARFCLFAPLSRRNESPAQAHRPFDRDRDGLVLGEGGAVFMVEELDQARRRQAHIYAEVVGTASTMDPGRAGPGLERALRQALARAGCTPADIDHVNTQGNATLRNDAWEAQAIARVFGPDFPVTAYKSLFGHLGAGSATVETAVSLLAQQQGVLPPSRNWDHPDPACPVRVVTAARAVNQPCFVKISLTEMGQCAVAVLRRWS